MQILFLPLMFLGLPVAIIAAICGKRFGDGTGNESGMAEFFAFSYGAGIVLALIILVVVAFCLAL